LYEEMMPGAMSNAGISEQRIASRPSRARSITDSPRSCDEE